MAATAAIVFATAWAGAGISAAAPLLVLDAINAPQPERAPALGLPKLQQLPAVAIWPEGANRLELPPATHLATVAKGLKPGYVMVDVENLFQHPQGMAHGGRIMRQIVDYLKRNRPSPQCLIGVYTGWGADAGVRPSRERIGEHLERYIEFANIMRGGPEWVGCDLYDYEGPDFPLAEFEERMRYRLRVERIHGVPVIPMIRPDHAKTMELLPAAKLRVTRDLCMKHADGWAVWWWGMPDQKLAKGEWQALLGRAPYRP